MDYRTSTVDSELEVSTAPTTPDGSLSFSPILPALRLQDALERESISRGGEMKALEALDNICPSLDNKVKNICCIGAGYVGTDINLGVLVRILTAEPRWTNCSCYGIS